MNYKKILIILLSIINIVLVLTLLIKPRIETFQEEQQQCLPFENTFPVGPTPTTIAGPQISDLMEYFCNTFVVIFLINDPDNCQQDRRCNQIYDDNFAGESDNDNLGFTDTVIRKLNYDQFDSYKMQYEGLRLSEVLDTVSTEKVISPIIIIKRFNSVVLEVHRQGDLSAGTGNSNMPLELVNTRDKAIDFINALKCDYAEAQQEGSEYCLAPETCTVNIETSAASGGGAGSPGSPAAGGVAGGGVAGGGTSGGDTSGRDTSGGGTSGGDTSGGDTSGGDTSGGDTSGGGTSGGDTSGGDTSGGGTSGRGTSGRGTSGRGTSGRGTSGRDTSGRGTSGGGTSGGGSTGGRSARLGGGSSVVGTPGQGQVSAGAPVSGGSVSGGVAASDPLCCD